MPVKKLGKKPLAESKIDVKVKLAAMWTGFMFFYIYVDYFHLYMPGALQEMLAGKVFVFDVSQLFLLASLISIMIPTLMIFLSITMSASLNRWTNIVVATVYIPYTLFNLAGEAWIHMMLGAAVEVVLLVMIIGHALKWPRTEV